MSNFSNKAGSLFGWRLTWGFGKFSVLHGTNSWETFQTRESSCPDNAINLVAITGLQINRRRLNTTEESARFMSSKKRGKEIIVEQLGVNPEQVTPTLLSLRISALARNTVELVMAFEEDFRSSS